MYEPPSYSVLSYILTDSTSDFGDSYPSCEVIGTDISPIQSSWVPPNVKLYV